jgi:hypothetical protein
MDEAQNRSDSELRPVLTQGCLANDDDMKIMELKSIGKTTGCRYPKTAMRYLAASVAMSPMKWSGSRAYLKLYFINEELEAALVSCDLFSLPVYLTGLDVIALSDMTRQVDAKSRSSRTRGSNEL